MLQIFEPLHIGGLQPAVLGLPLVVRGGTDAVVPPDLIDGATGVGLFRIATICVSQPDWRMGTSWLGWLFCQNVRMTVSIYGGSLHQVGEHQAPSTRPDWSTWARMIVDALVVWRQLDLRAGDN